MTKLVIRIAVLAALMIPCVGLASQSDLTLDLTYHWAGFAALSIFVLAYALVIAEEFTLLKKSMPVMLAAGLIWAVIGYQYATESMPHAVEQSVRHFLIEFAELFLFLLTAMTYVNSMSERRVFSALRTWLVDRQLSYRKLFWITGAIAFFLSPVIDNLTTALVMCAVLLAVGKDSPKFVSIGCVNIVVAANAGGAFSPFGDITTLMVWQSGQLEFEKFLVLFVPSVVNYVVPATLMSLAVPNNTPQVDGEVIAMQRGARTIMFLFGCTITTAVAFHTYLDLPPFLGMMTGLSYLQLYGYYSRRTHKSANNIAHKHGLAGEVTAFDSFRQIARSEWDTLLFFFGVIMCVGGLGFIGYLEQLSQYAYTGLGPTTANILLGLASSIVDNIPVMVAVLQMNPDMDVMQWLLITLTAGVGGSLLSIGSAAGVALMGQARGTYTFFSHLKWTPAIAVGYALSIWVHLMINKGFAGVAVG